MGRAGLAAGGDEEKEVQEVNEIKEVKDQTTHVKWVVRPNGESNTEVTESTEKK